ncbi:hypothetical protein GOBAR_AA37398 [Gossypium barbadense]|uniref:Uncharacterized protein n=1 Tax=Gossypium barbadense TaxID=3634 RepID=A0A2P5VWV7_GOSBA|nr:hypothetical protein GOBAR_AA37398 [Gossypium barbadense]
MWGNRHQTCLVCGFPCQGDYMSTLIGLGKMRDSILLNGGRPPFRLQGGLLRELSPLHAQLQAAHCPTPLHVDNYRMSGGRGQIAGSSSSRSHHAWNVEDMATFS